MKKKTVQQSRAKTSTVHHSEETQSFLVHAILYLLVNFALFIYLYSNSQDMAVFYWVVAGWGVGLFAHAMAVFGFMKFLAKEW